MREPIAMLVLTAALAACAVRPSEVGDATHIVVVKSVRLPDRDWLPWYTRFAEHAWIDLEHDGQWHRIEWNQHQDEVGIDRITEERARMDERWERPIAVHGVFTGDFARTLARRVLACAKSFPFATDYRAWPGPNSNTFVDWLARESGLPLHLPPNAVGKDYTGWLRIGPSSSGSGVEIETALAGVQVGLREGLELHVIGLTLGVGFWPPQLKLPFLPAIPGGWIAPGDHD